MPANQQHRGFTLIELLVVISIIGLLMSILLPSLSRARKQARTVLCLAHLRELSHGWHMYADENNDISLPGRFAKEPGGTSNPANWYDVGNGLKYRPRWVATMGKQVGVFAFNEPSTSDDRQDYDSNVYQCPSAAAWIDERNYAYGYNHQFLGNARKTNGRFHNFPINRSRIRSFAGTVLGADCMGTAAGVPRRERRSYSNQGTDFTELGNHGWTLDPPRLTETSDRGTGDAGSPRTAVDPRHLGRANVVFCDGHAVSLTPEQLGYRTLSGGAYVDLQVVDDQPTNRLFSGSGRDDDPPDLPAA
ncbi:MAG: prepilin-type N-terminal cleavage/methylation domain-containing protein [Phycisphaerae bacterium]